MATPPSNPDWITDGSTPDRTCTHFIGELKDKHAGKPILVIGGGPSASADLERIPRDYPACVISANQHGFKQDRFEVDYIVNVDFMNGTDKRLMRLWLKDWPRRPIINRWSWADYRLPDWQFGGDSGLTAILVATMLGGHPVVATGMDRNIGNKQYFWQPEPPIEWKRRFRPTNVDNIRQQYHMLKSAARDGAIRPMSGPLKDGWPLWKLEEQLPPFVPTVFRMLDQGDLYMVNRQFFLHPTDPVSTGPIRLTSTEAKRAGDAVARLNSPG